MIVHDISLALLFDEIDWLYDRYMQAYCNTIDYTPIGSFGKLRILRAIHDSVDWDIHVYDLSTRYPFPTIEIAHQFLEELHQMISMIILPLFHGSVKSLYELRFCKGISGSVEFIMYMTADEWEDNQQGYFWEGALHNPPTCFMQGEENKYEL